MSQRVGFELIDGDRDALTEVTGPIQPGEAVGVGDLIRRVRALSGRRREAAA